jgi:hypothetical protein
VVSFDGYRKALDFGGPDVELLIADFSWSRSRFHLSKVVKAAQEASKRYRRFTRHRFRHLSVHPVD